MAVKINLRIRTKNHAADPEIGFLPKSISKPGSHALTMPIAWELKFLFFLSIYKVVRTDAKSILLNLETILTVPSTSRLSSFK